MPTITTTETINFLSHRQVGVTIESALNLNVVLCSPF